MNKDVLDRYIRQLAERMKRAPIEEPDISCPTCGAIIYCGKVEDMCKTRPCGLLERRKEDDTQTNTSS